MPMLDGWTCRLRRDVAGPQVIGVKSVIAHKDHCRAFIDQAEQCAEHRVMIAVGIGNDVLVKGEVLLCHPRQLRRMITHEGMAEMIDAAIINRSEIPGL